MRTYHQRQFFTLLEVLSVIGIIAIVAGIVLGGMSYAGRRADQAKTISLMTQLEMALDAFKQDRGYYPPVATAASVKFLTDGSELKLQLQLPPPGATTTQYTFVHSSTQRPYLEIGWVTDVAKSYDDAWGNAFQYCCPGTNNTSSYDLWSLGADGAPGDKKVSGDVPGNGDDICNWKRN